MMETMQTQKKLIAVADASTLSKSEEKSTTSDPAETNREAMMTRTKPSSAPAATRPSKEA
jgi:hypothetical protein